MNYALFIYNKWSSFVHFANIKYLKYFSAHENTLQFQCIYAHFMHFFAINNHSLRPPEKRLNR